MERVRTHAENFVFNRERQLEHLSSIVDRRPIVVAPYDAELFGHWWFEGPEFLEQVLRRAASPDCSFSMITASDYLEMYPENQVAFPSMSSWG